MISSIILKRTKLRHMQCRLTNRSPIARAIMIIDPDIKHHLSTSPRPNARKVSAAPLEMDVEAARKASEAAIAKGAQCDEQIRLIDAAAKKQQLRFCAQSGSNKGVDLDCVHQFMCSSRLLSS